MKIEHLIVQQLFRNKKVTLQDIGSFYLSGEVILPPEPDKGLELPENAVRFEFDRHAPLDEDFIAFIVEKTGKMRPLASSDIESFSLFARQFINIGKPFTVEGLGVLQKNQEGNYEFVPGIEIHPPASTQAATPLKEKQVEDIQFSISKTPRPKSRKWGWLGLILFILAVMASVFFYLKDRKENNELQKFIPAADTIKKDKPPLIPDSANLRNNLIAKRDSTQKNDSLQLVFKSYNSYAAARSALEKFRTFGHAANMFVSADSSKYELYLSFPRPIADTTRIIDSIGRFFGTKAYIRK